MNSTRSRIGALFVGLAFLVSAKSGFCVGFCFNCYDPPPPLSVTVGWPTNGTVVTNQVITASGSATGTITNMQSWVENVPFGQNFQGLAISSPWSFEASLVGGYNTVGVRATANNGIYFDGYSRIYFKQLTPLALSINGPGKVTPNLNGRILETSVNCQMTAKPSPGYAFAGWSGDLITNSSTLNFAMASNLVLQANFVPTPFASAAGTYQGAIGAMAATEDSVSFKAKISRDGTFTAKVQLKNATYGNVVNGNYAISGAFSADGSYSGIIHRKKLSGRFPVNLQLQLDVNSRTISGTIADTYPNWTGALSAQSLKP